MPPLYRSYLNIPWKSFNEAKLQQNLCSVATVPSMHMCWRITGALVQRYLRVGRLRHDQAQRLPGARVPRPW